MKDWVVVLLFCVGAFGQQVAPEDTESERKIVALADEGVDYAAGAETSKAITSFKKALSLCSSFEHKNFILHHLANAYSDLAPPANHKGLEEVMHLFDLHLSSLNTLLLQHNDSGSDGEEEVGTAVSTEVDGAKRAPKKPAINVELELIWIDALWTEQRVMAMQAANAGEYVFNFTSTGTHSLPPFISFLISFSHEILIMHAPQIKCALFCTKIVGGET